MTKVEDLLARFTKELESNPELIHRAEIAYRFLLDPQALVISQGALDLASSINWEPDEAKEVAFFANVKSWLPQDPEEVVQERVEKEKAWRMQARWNRIVIHRKPNNYVRVMINEDRNTAYLVPRIRKPNGGFWWKAVGIPQSKAGLFEASLAPAEILLVHRDLIESIGTLPVPNWPGSLMLNRPADMLLGEWESSGQVWDLKRYMEYVRTHGRNNQPWNL